jgi:hypothetical protein
LVIQAFVKGWGRNWEPPAHPHLYAPPSVTISTNPARPAESFTINARWLNMQADADARITFFLDTGVPIEGCINVFRSQSYSGDHSCNIIMTGYNGQKRNVGFVSSTDDIQDSSSSSSTAHEQRQNN